MTEQERETLLAEIEEAGKTIGGWANTVSWGSEVVLTKMDGYALAQIGRVLDAAAVAVREDGR